MMTARVLLLQKFFSEIQLCFSNCKSQPVTVTDISLLGRDQHFKTRRWKGGGTHPILAKLPGCSWLLVTAQGSLGRREQMFGGAECLGAAPEGLSLLSASRGREYSLS